MREWVIRLAKLTSGVLFVGVILFPMACGQLGSSSGYLASTGGSCQNTVVSGSCGTTPPFARVQVVPAGDGQGTTAQIIRTANNESQTITETAGNLLVAFAYSGQNPGGSSGGTAPNMTFAVSDTLGNTFYPGPYVNNGTYNDSAIQIFYAVNIKGGANTVTMTETAGVGTSWAGLVLFEYSGIATTNPVDVSSALAASSATTLYNPGAITAQTACDLVVGGMANGHIDAAAVTAGSGWVEPVLDHYDPAAFVDNVATGTSYGAAASATMTAPSDNGWVATQMAFRANNTQALCQPTQVAFISSAQSVTHAVCSGAVALQSENSTGQPAPASAGINIALSGSGLTFYADSACAYPITNIILGAGTSTNVFYYKAASAGSPTITGSSAGYTSFSQTETSL